jgi:hypothetical protein
VYNIILICFNITVNKSVSVGFNETPTAQHVSGILLPIIRSFSTAAAASGLPLERGGSSAVGRCSLKAPDDGQEDVRNMLSCI